MEQATIRFARLDQPIVHAETTGAMNKRAQPARRTSRRRRRLERRRCEHPGVVQNQGSRLTQGVRPGGGRRAGGGQRRRVGPAGEPQQVLGAEVEALPGGVAAPAIDHLRTRRAAPEARTRTGRTFAKCRARSCRVFAKARIWVRTPSLARALRRDPSRRIVLPTARRTTR